MNLEAKLTYEEYKQYILLAKLNEAKESRYSEDEINSYCDWLMDSNVSSPACHIVNEFSYNDYEEDNDRWFIDEVLPEIEEYLEEGVNEDVLDLISKNTDLNGIQNEENIQKAYILYGKYYRLKELSVAITNLYDLKDRALKETIVKNKLSAVGYHEFVDMDRDFYIIGNYSFHLNENNSDNNLGEINDLIPSNCEVDDLTIEGAMHICLNSSTYDLNEIGKALYMINKEAKKYRDERDLLGRDIYGDTWNKRTEYYDEFEYEEEFDEWVMEM